MTRDPFKGLDSAKGIDFVETTLPARGEAARAHRQASESVLAQSLTDADDLPTIGRARPWRPRPNFARTITFSPRVFARLMTPYFHAALARESGGSVAAPADPEAWCWRERHGAA